MTAPRSAPPGARPRAGRPRQKPRRPRPHRAAHEGEIEGRDDGSDAADAPRGDGDRLAAGTERRMRLAQPLSVALPVAEAQRIDRHPRQRHRLERTIIEQNLEAGRAVDAEVVTAITAHFEISREL